MHRLWGDIDPPLCFEDAPFDPALRAVVGGGFFLATISFPATTWALKSAGRALADVVAGDKLRHNNDMKTCQSGADAMGAGTQTDSMPAMTLQRIKS